MTARGGRHQWRTITLFMGVSVVAWPQSLLALCPQIVALIGFAALARGSSEGTAATTAMRASALLAFPLSPRTTSLSAIFRGLGDSRARP
ncbi:MAG: hypothetical protein ACLU0O_08525 [Collinsella sp.]